VINGLATPCTAPAGTSITATESTCQPGCTLGGGAFNVIGGCDAGTTLTYYTTIGGNTVTSAPSYNQTSPMSIFYSCVDNTTGCRSAVQSLTTIPGTCPAGPSSPLITADESTCQSGCAVSGGSFNVTTSCGPGTTLTYFTDISGSTTTGAPTYNPTSPVTIFYACVDDLSGCKSTINTLTTVPGTCVTPAVPVITATESTCQPGCILGGGSFNINSSCGIGSTITYYTDISGSAVIGTPVYDQSSPMTIYYACVNNTTGCSSAIQSLTTVPGTCINPADPLITANESTCQSGCAVSGGSFQVSTSCGAGSTLNYYNDLSGLTGAGTPVYDQTSPTTIYYACVNNSSGCRSNIKTLTTVPGVCPAPPSNPEIVAIESTCQPGCNLGGGSFNITTACGAGSTLIYFTDLSGGTTTSAPSYNQIHRLLFFMHALTIVQDVKVIYKH
jgi:hypothetical protein